MNLRLTPAQIDDIFEAAEHVDVPVEQLLDAAAEIRAALLGAGGEIVLPDTPLVVGEPRAADCPPVRRIESMRRTRLVRTALVAAVLALATLLSVAVAGALPAPLQTPIAKMAELFGIDLPKPEPTPTVETTGGARVSSTNAPITGGAAGAAGGAGNASAVPAAPTDDATDSAPAEAEVHGPPDNPGNAYAYGVDHGSGVPPGIPGNGPPGDPGKPGNGPPEDPGNGNGLGPPAPPGTGNGNNPDGPGA